MRRIEKIITGVCLIAFGVCVALERFGVINVDLLFDGWWTLFIIIPCLIGLFTGKDKTGNLIGIAVGVCFLLSANGISVWKFLLPAVLVAIGVGLLFPKSKKNEKIEEKVESLKKELSGEDDLQECLGLFSSKNVSAKKDGFRGAELTAVFGSVKFDLRGVTLEDDVLIEAAAVFGSISLYVDEGTEVRIRSASIFGGVGDEREKQPKSETAEETPIVYVNALSVLGGIKINGKTEKE